jgi:hypothetical protein
MKRQVTVGNVLFHHDSPSHSQNYAALHDNTDVPTLEIFAKFIGSTNSLTIAMNKVWSTHSAGGLK